VSLNQPVRIAIVEANLRKSVDDAWPLLIQGGLSAGPSRDRLTFSSGVAEAALGSEHMNGGTLLRRSAT